MPWVITYRRSQRGGSRKKVMGSGEIFFLLDTLWFGCQKQSNIKKDGNIVRCCTARARLINKPTMKPEEFDETCARWWHIYVLKEKRETSSYSAPKNPNNLASSRTPRLKTYEIGLLFVLYYFIIWQPNEIRWHSLPTKLAVTHESQWTVLSHSAIYELGFKKKRRKCWHGRKKKRNSPRWSRHFEPQEIFWVLDSNNSSSSCSCHRRGFAWNAIAYYVLNVVPHSL